MSFIQPPFWSRDEGYSRRAPMHATSVLVTPPAITEPMDLATAKGYARITGTDLDTLFPGWIAAARQQVEQDTGLALPTQTRDLAFDALPSGLWRAIELPAQSTPLQSVTNIKYTTWDNVLTTIDPSAYVVDLTSLPARIGLSVTGAFWPVDGRPFQPWTMRIVSGYVDVAHIPPLLVRAVGLLVGYYANEGSDRFTAANMKDQYDEAISPFKLMTVA